MTEPEPTQEAGEGFSPPPPPPPRLPNLLFLIPCAAASLALAGIQLRAQWPAGRPFASTSFDVAHEVEAGGAAAGREASRRAAAKPKGFRAPPSCLKKQAARATEEWQQCGTGERQRCGEHFTPFLIMFGGETGTEHLGNDILGSHPQLTWVSEAHASCFFDMLRSGVGLPSSQLAAGTKTQIPRPFERLYGDGVVYPPNMRIIHITRHNAIAWGLSKLHKEELVACRDAKTGGNRSEKTQKCSDFIYSRRQIPIGRLKKIMHMKGKTEEMRNQLVQMLESRGHMVLRTSYEEMVADEPRVVARIMQFLGVSPVETTGPERAKRASGDLRDSFSNWPEVVAAFCGTELEPALGLGSDEPCAR